MFPVNVIGEGPPANREVEIRADGSSQKWEVPEETPVAFVYNRRNYAVMLATPQDILNYVVGFSLTERIIDSPKDITALDILHSERGIDLRVTLTEKRFELFDLRHRRRNLPGNAGCGVCGLENADEFFTPLPTVSEKKVSVDRDAIARAFDSLSAMQPINQRTRSVHAAAWVDFKGAILRVREDVGRHNALDKLLGAMALTGVDPKTGFVLMSSRCSYELVEKAARCGVTALASLSGPTSFAIRKASEANMALYARAPEGVVELVTD